MKMVVQINSNDIAKLPIEMLVAATQPGWKTFSCKRRINEYCDEAGWKMLEEAIEEAHRLYQAIVYQNSFNIDAKRFVRIEELISWAASIVYYGTTGIKQL